MIFYEPAHRDRDLLPHDPFKAMIAPRPIGWVSAAGRDGGVNLAPYSFFNAVADTPPMLLFSSMGMKDSATYAFEGGEFCWNMPTWDLREQMNASSSALPRGESEFEHAGLTMMASRLVAAPRVAESPVSLECRVAQSFRLRDADGHEIDNHIVIGQVVGVHLDEALITPDGRFDTAAARPIARCGYRDEYAVVDELFSMPRP